MSSADEIRDYVINQIITPARIMGKRFVIVRSGDIHKAMNLRNSMPNVCSAIDTNKILIKSGAKLISRKGPNQSSTVEWVFEI